MNDSSEHPHLVRWGTPLTIPRRNDFHVRKHFVISTSSSAEVPIAELSAQFLRFMDILEIEVEEGVLCQYRPTEPCASGLLYKEAGGIHHATTRFAHMFFFLRQAERVLERRYVFFILDEDDTPWLITATWSRVGAVCAWRIRAERVPPTFEDVFTYKDIVVAPH